MTFEDRMGQNARHMMETMMEVTKDMCEKINKRDDVFDEFFLPGCATGSAGMNSAP